MFVDRALRRYDSMMVMMTLPELRGHEDDLTARLTAVRADLALRNALSRELPALVDRIAAVRSGGPYRTENLAKLEKKLDEARTARVERRSLRLEEAKLLREAESLREQLEENGIRKISLPMLETVKIAAPCVASWADMEGDTDVRFCTSCEKSVYNLSMMSREEAEAVIGAAREKDICLRFYRRADGTVLTEDCPVGVRRLRFWRRAKGIAAAGLIAGALGVSYYKFISKTTCRAQSTESPRGDVTVTMGLGG